MQKKKKLTRFLDALVWLPKWFYSSWQSKPVAVYEFIYPSFTPLIAPAGTKVKIRPMVSTRGLQVHSAHSHILSQHLQGLKLTLKKISSSPELQALSTHSQHSASAYTGIEIDWSVAMHMLLSCSTLKRNNTIAAVIWTNAPDYYTYKCQNRNEASRSENCSGHEVK